MNRATWLQDRRMQRFRDVLSRWEGRELSMMDAAEMLGLSERQFRRYRDRFEEEGEAGLIDRRLGKVSPKRIGAAEVERMLHLYRRVYRGWNVKHSTSMECAITGSAGAIAGPRPSCIRPAWWSVRCGAGRTVASARGSRARA